MALALNNLKRVDMSLNKETNQPTNQPIINILQMITNKSTKRPHFESSDSEPEIIYQNTPTYMVIQSTKDIPITKISPFKIKPILSKQIKPTTIKKLTNGTILIDIKKTQMEEILKWETFNNIKIKTHLTNL